MKTVLYIGNFSFPLGNAAGKRVYANGKLMRKLGYRVLYVGTDNEMQNNSKLKDTKREYDGFEYFNFAYPRSKYDWINYNSFYNNLIELINDMNLKLDLVIYYGSPTLSFFDRKLIKFCKINRIKIVSDCVDWLTTKTNNPIFNLIKGIDNTYQKSYLNKQVDGLIVISRYLENYYKKAGLKTVIIPPLSPDKFENMSVSNRYKKIVYAGLPFRKGQPISNLDVLKDRIDKMIELMAKAKEKGATFIFDIYGFTREEYLTVIPSQKTFVDLLENNIVFHGMQTNNKIIEAIIKADFTLLIRDVNRDTSAGFPTKVSESISCGTPVITTKTSDLEDYIKDNVNSFFLEPDVERALPQLIKILSLNKSAIKQLKINCKDSEVFFWEKHTEQFSRFIDSI